MTGMFEILDIIARRARAIIMQYRTICRFVDDEVLADIRKEPMTFSAKQSFNRP